MHVLISMHVYKILMGSYGCWPKKLNGKLTGGHKSTQRFVKYASTLNFIRIKNEACGVWLHVYVHMRVCFFNSNPYNSRAGVTVAIHVEERSIYTRQAQSKLDTI